MKLILLVLVAGVSHAQITMNAPPNKNMRTPLANVVYASQIPGVVLDANLDGASGQTCTDNSDRLNAVLRAATTLHPVDLVMDGPSCIGNTGGQMCLDIRGLSNVTIEGIGWGSGFFLKAGANCAAISNITLYGNGKPQAKTANIQVKNLRISGNADQVCEGGVCFGIKIFDADNVVVDNVYITNVKYFATGFGNVSNVTVTNNTMLQGPGTGGDPIHFTGPFSNVYIANNKLQSGDDCIALNLPEAYGGNASNVLIANNQMVGEGCSDFMRIYNNVGGGANPTYRITGVVVDGVIGKVTCTANPAVFYFGEASGGGAFAEANTLKASHIDVDGSSNCMLAQMHGTWGSVDFSDWILRNPKANTPAIQYFADVTSSTITGGVIERYAAGQATSWPIQVGAATVKNLQLSNIVVTDPSDSNFNAAPQLLDIVAGTVSQMTLGTPFNGNGKISNLYSNGSAARVTSIAGADNFIAVPATSCGTASGNNTAGTIAAASALSGCTLTFGGRAQSAGWTCSASNWTHPASALVQTAGSGTTAVLTGTISNGDALSYQCRAY